MTIQAIRENLEEARQGLRTIHPDPPGTVIIGPNGEVRNGESVTVQPGLHEAKLYSICEGLIVEIERLQGQTTELAEALARATGFIRTHTHGSGLA